MKLIKPYYKILNETDLIHASKEIELAARTCYKSEDKIDENSDIKLIEKLISSGHEAMLEFGPSITVKFVCDRGVSHELVRHRLCSFAQESTRYCNYSKDKFDNQITFIIPCWLKLEEGEYDFINTEMNFENLLPGTEEWLAAVIADEENYNFLISKGWQPQQARSVLPNSLKTEIVVKANIREWRHIFVQRTSKKAHPQMRELMVPLLKHFQLMCPTLFNDIKIEE
jgi:thymidylate synthase (FAD)